MGTLIQQKNKIIDKYPLSIIIFLYLVANLFMLLNNGRYWDDWCISSTEGLKAISYGVGTPFMIPFYSWYINLTSYPALLFHITTGVFEILGIVVFYKCLSLMEVNRSTTLLLTLFFALLPYNLTKITMACFTYSIGFLFFLVAILFFVYFIRKNNFIERIISLIFFFCSFSLLPSTLVLALAFFLFMAIWYQKQEVELKLRNFKIILIKLLKWADFILIPFVFWIFRTFFLKPTGIYAASGYREFSVHSVLKTPINLILTFIQNFIGLGTLINPLNSSNIYDLLFVAILIMVLLLVKKHKIVHLPNSKNMLYIGLYFFIAGAFAYAMLGLIPLFDSYNSRHQILLKFGSPFILYYIINLIHSTKAQKFFISIIISLFIVATISSQLQYQKSWFKQMALVKVFAQEKALREGTNFIILDNTTAYNEYNEGYRFYCYTGILKKSFGTQTRFAIDSKELAGIFDQYNPQIFIDNAFYNMKDCKNITSFNYSVTINPGSMLLSTTQNLKLLYQYYFKRVKFEKSLNEILLLKVSPYNAEIR